MLIYIFVLQGQAITIRQCVVLYLEWRFIKKRTQAEHSDFSSTASSEKNKPETIQQSMWTCLWSLSPLPVPKARWTLWALGCRNQTDKWSLRPAVCSSARGGQHRSSQAGCWGSGAGWAEREPSCVGGVQRHVPAASPEPPQHPEPGGVEEDEGRRPFSSSRAPYLHREGGRWGRERERWCIWGPHKSAKSSSTNSKNFKIFWFIKY